MALQDRLRAARAFDPARFVPFVVDGLSLGRVRRDLATHLRRFRETFCVRADSIGFPPDLDTFERRTAAMAEVARYLAGDGWLSPWRNETYDIGGDPARPAAFALERAAVRFFGFTAQAVHVNGLVETAGGGWMWIARRSPSKAIDPGMLDTLVGGGLASRLSVAETLLKESWEEAGIPRALASTACAAGRLEVLREVPEGLHAEIIHVNDLALPPGFTPVNQDGEVAEFRLAPLDDVARELAGDAPFTIDAAVVAIDCLQRRGVLRAQ